VVERRNDSCVVSLFAKKLKKGGPRGATEESLFAQCQLDLGGGSSGSEKKVEHFVESVSDSSRYFVIRISDEKTGRHANIGIGFRERDDASNFRMALQEYERSLQRERTAEAIHTAYCRGEEEQGKEGESTTVDDYNNRKPSPLLLPQVGNLTLKEGEKIHMDLLSKKNRSEKPKPPPPSTNKASSGALPLLKKPPPSPAAISTAQQQQQEEEEIKEVGGINLDEAISDVASSYSGSEGAVADLTDDDEWNDFEGSQN
jgi:hypothetical protein